MKKNTLNPIDMEWVKEIKILGITFKNARDPNTLKQWETLTNKIKNRQDKFSYKITTIFSRTFLLNTFILSKLNYIIQTFDVPISKLKEIEGHIFSYLFFSKTRPSIARKTLTQTKLNGGTQIQDTISKQEAYKLELIKKITKNPQSYPFGTYYLGNYLQKYLKFDNNTPHHSPENKLPLFL